MVLADKRQRDVLIIGPGRRRIGLLGRGLGSGLGLSWAATDRRRRDEHQRDDREPVVRSAGRRNGEFRRVPLCGPSSLRPWIGDGSDELDPCQNELMQKHDVSSLQYPGLTAGAASRSDAASINQAGGASTASADSPRRRFRCRVVRRFIEPGEQLVMIVLRLLAETRPRQATEAEAEARSGPVDRRDRRANHQVPTASIRLAATRRTAVATTSPEREDLGRVPPTHSHQGHRLGHRLPRLLVAIEPLLERVGLVGRELTGHVAEGEPGEVVVVIREPDPGSSIRLQLQRVSELLEGEPHPGEHGAEGKALVPGDLGECLVVVDPGLDHPPLLLRERSERPADGVDRLASDQRMIGPMVVLVASGVPGRRACVGPRRPRLADGGSPGPREKRPEKASPSSFRVEPCGRVPGLWRRWPASRRP